jgi:hypothetical protein
MGHLMRWTWTPHVVHTFHYLSSSSSPRASNIGMPHVGHVLGGGSIESGSKVQRERVSGGGRRRMHPVGEQEDKDRGG